jgi:hypothetical protein
MQRKVIRVAEYLTRGHVITATTSMADVLRIMTAPPAAPAVVPCAVDPTQNAPKVYVNALESFSGAPIDWEDWSVKTSATLGQTAYAMLLTSAPTPGNIIEVTRDREFFNMLKAAT